MIEKILETEYGYRLYSNTTNEEWHEFYKSIHKQLKVSCVICNNETSKLLRPGILSNNIVTVNNKLKYGEIYFNRIG